ncbi:ATP phosphoribosyltransferase regulatory subunit [Halothermothrix orenii]|uniref:ATP phosphoribosyltransferase regulatory subunit n=1 Tax=Halothermothrix orenii (strain H 168 / OCM 544 / DSM 9562) TaxID=373903 RepID=HISZ_HALOH|nr:ATP phosphoribosyltransferase regulatory subunit [Halothermothrix orenii]B8D110.1 RecName: Full=ATP phosphoribosyltransferase regulatory subunit [Halothermothrix orenii H 168]ACL68979.1 histidyl-tRNA synthetase [Halothermothrix orenii H 168]
MTENILNSPGGMRSYLDSIAFQLEEIQDRIKGVFRQWAYRPIITPTLEYYESLTTGIGEKYKKQMYKFIDYEGNILALRPEMTAPIARTVANKIDELCLPQRLSYRAPVFRYEEPQTGKNREIYQIGVELIGEKSPGADAEVIMLAVESLKSSGLTDFQIDIGHAGFLNGVIEELKVTDSQGEQIKRWLNKKDMVSIRDFTSRVEIKNINKLLGIVRLRGKKEVLQRAKRLINNDKSKKALKDLELVYEYLCDYGVDNYVNFDLTLIRGFEYYTGIVFEAFTENLGYTICGGGRYDSLIYQYCGKEIPAIGFAIGIERVRLGLLNQGQELETPEIDVMVVFSYQARKPALEAIKKYRKQGLNVLQIEKEEVDQEFIKKHLKTGVKKIISFCEYSSNQKIKVIDDRGNIELLTPGGDLP